MKLSDLITVAPRFARAVNVERDIALPGAIEGYTVTSTVREFLGRMIQSLHAVAGHRAWTLTGPYGSGKSAFALYAANLFGPSSDVGTQLARRILREQAPELHQKMFGVGRSRTRIPNSGFCTIVVTGGPESIVGAVLKACCRDLKPFYATSGRPFSGFKRLEKLCETYEKKGSVSQSEFLEAFRITVDHLYFSRRARGVVMIIDELGKFLEHGALFPEGDDIYLLQQLAESTASFTDSAFLLITILHQSFERYAAELRPTIRDEWAKVQGRFEDVAFQESPEQLFVLIASAISHADHPITASLRKKARQEAERAVELSVLPRGISRRDFIEAAGRCAPLHVLTVLTLIRLCRKFGQNQRSLFSFLTSREPHGFGNFLQQDVTTGSAVPSFTLANLYDYVAESLGNSLVVGEAGARWAEIQSALDRAVELPASTVDVLKAIGLLTAVGSYGGLSPSASVVQAGLSMDTRRFKSCQETLLGESLIVERKHSGTLALWEGSDIDIEERLREAKERVAEPNLPQVINELSYPRPIVAKRHSFYTGTLRYFGVRFTDLENFSRSLIVPDDADGVLLYGLPASKTEFEELIKLAQSSQVREQINVVVAVPREVNALREAIREMRLLDWVQHNTRALQGDAVARRELRYRMAIARERVDREIDRLFSPGEQLAQHTLWFHHGIRQEISSARTLASLVSSVCDQVYSATPILRNELVNRRQLSSAAAAARRNLIDAMITKGGETNLGFVGMPPEASIYASVLKQTRIHRQDGKVHTFRAPAADSPTAQVWRAMIEFLKSCELERHSVKELFDTLKRAPYGLKSGVIPILFCAAVLAHDTEVAFYENGAFTPELSVELFERLIRSPEKFELRRYRIQGVRREIFRLMAQLFGKELDPHSANLVAIVKPLFSFFHRLPQYTKQTKNLSEVSIRIKEALFNSRDPECLLFQELPLACGAEPFKAKKKLRADELNSFFATLQNALLELQRAYDELLTDLRTSLYRVFSSADIETRERITMRARNLERFCIEPRLKSFVHQLQDSSLNEAAWVEAISTIVVGKEPRLWTDLDKARYDIRATELVRTFKHLEVLAFEDMRRSEQGARPEHIFRLSVSDRFSNEKEAVISVEPAEAGKFSQAVVVLDELVERLCEGSSVEIALAALSSVSQKYLTEIGESRDVTAVAVKAEHLVSK